MRPFLLLAALLPSIACADSVYDQTRIDQERAAGEAMGYVYPAVVSLAPPKLEDVGTAKAGEIVQGSPVAKGSSCRHFLAMDPMCISGDRGEWVSEAGGTSCRLTCKYRLTATPVRQLASDSSATVPCYMGMTDGTGTPNCESTGASQSGPFLVSPAR